MSKSESWVIEVLECELKRGSALAGSGLPELGSDRHNSDGPDRNIWNTGRVSDLIGHVEDGEPRDCTGIPLGLGEAQREDVVHHGLCLLI